MGKHELILQLQKDGVLKTSAIIKAFNDIDRVKFVRPEHIKMAYEDEPLHIGFEQTISQPRTVAFMLEQLQPSKGDKILDIGSGSGWTTALLASLVGDQGSCIGVEIIPDLVKFGQFNLQKYDMPNAQILLVESDILGCPSLGPYNKILVSAASINIPQELLDQLVIGGILVIPVFESIVKIKRMENNTYSKQEFYGYRFVPLVRSNR